MTKRGALIAAASAGLLALLFGWLRRRPAPAPTAALMWPPEWLPAAGSASPEVAKLGIQALSAAQLRALSADLLGQHLDLLDRRNHASGAEYARLDALLVAVNARRNDVEREISARG